MTSQASNEARVLCLRPPAARQGTAPPPSGRPGPPPGAAPRTAPRSGPPPVPAREPLWRDLVGDVLRRERRAQERTLQDVADAARISMPYLSEIERGRKEASSEVLAAAAHALGLGLGDLLARVQGDLVRLTARTRLPGRTAPQAHRDGLCLAA
ncbi:helix-turn-helix domain-containing protein [Streptomyces tropicalis]|uniref:Helix-turn-helix transcriptional regulator n=1 Tax=Streptomyces tropicalis TaxID=3034234 RepID=A0ABT6AA18_9ACTN|nr:helix-turn-helix transcriptional regulator [Streptomyces tropicalis]MDF3301293.1 helix-turn-helix transcriptional regulator [Streptomyces tropicalis]